MLKYIELQEDPQGEFPLKEHFDKSFRIDPKSFGTTCQKGNIYIRFDFHEVK